MIFLVSFKSGEFWCSNVAIADDEQEIINYYGKKYPSVYVSEGNNYDLEEAERKGKPVKRF